MVGFGELRRLSLKWQTDIPAVEQVYALDWLLKAMFERPVLNNSLALEGSTALSKAYFPEYPPNSDLDVAALSPVEAASFEIELVSAAAEASRQSGSNYKLVSASATQARFQFTGPLGRRSAAQPQLVLRLFKGAVRSTPVTVPLIHPFSEPFKCLVRAMLLEEIAAKKIVLWSSRPRARDVYDLWFILKYGQARMNMVETRAIALAIAGQSGRLPGSAPDPQYLAILERAWDRALGQFVDKPAFAEAAAEINSRLVTLI